MEIQNGKQEKNVIMTEQMLMDVFQLAELAQALLVIQAINYHNQLTQMLNLLVSIAEIINGKQVRNAIMQVTN